MDYRILTQTKMNEMLFRWSQTKLESIIKCLEKRNIDKSYSHSTFIVIFLAHRKRNKTVFCSFSHAARSTCHFWYLEISSKCWYFPQKSSYLFTLFSSFDGVTLIPGVFICRTLYCSFYCSYVILSRIVIKLGKLT